MKCGKCGYDDNGTGDTAHVCGYHPTLLNDEEDFDIVVDVLQKQIAAFEKMNKDNARVAMNMGWPEIGIMDEIRYEQIWQMKKAIKIWNLLKGELS